MKLIHKREELEKNYPYPKDRLYELTIKVNNTPEADLIQKLTKLEDEVHRREILSTHLWRLRSHSTWLKIGDAPSHYFFKLIAAKRISEMIKVLALSDGRLT